LTTDTSGPIILSTLHDTQRPNGVREMDAITERLYAHARITPIQPQNRVKSVTKQADGALAVLLHSGQSYAISPEDDMFQAFVVWTVLNPNT